MQDFDPLKSLIRHEEEIKDAWDIVRIFEAERQKFEAQKNDYQARLNEMDAINQQVYEKQREIQEMERRESLLRDEVLKVRKELNELEHIRNAKKRNINYEYDEVESEVKHLSSDKAKVQMELEDSHTKLKNLKAEILKAEKILKERKKQKAHLTDPDKERPLNYIKPVIPFPSHEKQVEIQSKDGKKIIGNPYKKLYSFAEMKKLHEQLLDAQGMLENYSKGKVTLKQDSGDEVPASEYEKQISELNQKLMDLELENAKLGVEVRDLKAEQQLENQPEGDS